MDLPLSIERQVRSLDGASINITSIDILTPQDSMDQQKYRVNLQIVTDQLVEIYGLILNSPEAIIDFINDLKAQNSNNIRLRLKREG